MVSFGREYDRVGGCAVVSEGRVGYSTTALTADSMFWKLARESSAGCKINCMGKTIQAQQALPARAIDPDQILGEELSTRQMAISDLADFCDEVGRGNPLHQSGAFYLRNVDKRQLAGWIGQRIGHEGLLYGETISLPDMVTLASQIDRRADGLKVVLDRQRVQVLEQMEGWPELADKMVRMLPAFEELIHLDYSESIRSEQLKEVVGTISALDSKTEDAPWDLYELPGDDASEAMAIRTDRLLSEAGEDIYNLSTPLRALEALLYRGDYGTAARAHDFQMSLLMRSIFMIRLRSRILDGCQGQILTEGEQLQFETKIATTTQEVRNEMATMTEGFVDEALAALIPEP